MLLLDSSYIIGLIIKKDNLQQKAQILEPIIQHEKKLINNIVFTEVLNSLTATNSKYNADTLTKLLLSYNIHFLTPEDYKESILLLKHYNYSVNFSDCTILHTMFKNNINTIVSFDSDFDKIKNIHRIHI